MKLGEIAWNCKKLGKIAPCNLRQFSWLLQFRAIWGNLKQFEAISVAVSGDLIRHFLYTINFRTCHLFQIFLSTFAKFRQNFINIWLRNSSFDENLDWILVQFNIQFRKKFSRFLTKKLSLERCKSMSIL